MDQIKIGKFIAERRKVNSLTQAQLAEKLGITDRAVSKWENGRSMPDSSIMIDLCNALKINVNDLLCGEVVSMYNEKVDKKLVEMVKQKEQSDKRLLRLEIIIIVLLLEISCFISNIASLVELPGWVKILEVAQGIVILYFAIKIEQTAGYYQCSKCGHKYIPKFLDVFIARHRFRTRYMTCPKCGKRSWQKKVISLDEKNQKGEKQ